VDDGYSDQLFKFDAGKEEWMELVPVGNERPSHRHSHAAVVVKDTMIVFGGRTRLTPAKYTNETWVYSFALNQWKLLSTSGEIPHPRSYLTCIPMDNYLMIWGGYYWDGHEKYFNDLYTLNYETKSWKKIQVEGEIPHQRNRQSAVLLNTKTVGKSRIIIYGGNFYDDVKRRGAFYNDSYELSHDQNEQTWRWRKITVQGKAPKRGHHTAILYDDKIYMFGGECSRKRFNDIHVVYFVRSTE